MTESIFLSVEEVATKWKVSERTVRGYCSVGTLTAHHIGGKWIIPTYAVRQYEERTLNNGRRT